MIEGLPYFELLLAAASIIGVWIKHQKDYSELKVRVKALERDNNDIGNALRKLAEDIAEIKLLLARKQIDS